MAPKDPCKGGSKIFLAGPALLKASRATIPVGRSGGAEMQSAVSPLAEAKGWAYPKRTTPFAGHAIAARFTRRHRPQMCCRKSPYAPGGRTRLGFAPQRQGRLCASDSPSRCASVSVAVEAMQVQHATTAPQRHHAGIVVKTGNQVAAHVLVELS
jgi:hypothetical protein